MGQREQIDASTAAVKRAVEAGEDETSLTALIDRLAAASTPQAVSFDPSEIRRHAIKLTEAEETRAAAQRLMRAMTVARPKDPHNWATRALVARMASAHGEVREAATRALELGFEPKMPRMYRAYARLQLGDPAGAAEDADAVLAMPALEESERASVRSTRDQARQILKDIQIARDLRDDLVSGRRNAENLVRQWTGASLTSKDFTAAREGKRLIGKEHGWTLVRSYGVAEAVYDDHQRGDHKFAREVFAALALINPMDSYMWTMQAVGDFKLGNIDDALVGYSKAIELDPRSILARTHRGEIHFNRGDIETALLDLSVAVARDPAGEDPYANRARMLAWVIGDVLPRHADEAARVRGPLRLSDDWEEERTALTARVRTKIGAIDDDVERITSRLRDGISDDKLVVLLRDAIRPDNLFVLAQERFALRASELSGDEATRPQATALARALTRTFPDDAGLWSQRALVAVAAGDNADITFAATRAIERGATELLIYLVRAMALFNSFEPEAALADLDHILAADVPEKLKESARPMHERVTRAATAVRVVADARKQLEDGSLSPQELVRRWSPVPLTVVDLRDAAASKRRLLETFNWTETTLHTVAARAEAWFNEGHRALAHRIASALLLVDHGDASVRQLVEATAPEAPAAEPAKPKTREPARSEAPAPAANEVRILFLGANPSDQTRIALLREVSEIDERLHASDGGRIYRVLQAWEVQAARVQTLILRHTPQIVHFSGHGTSDGQLIFETADGVSAPMPIAAIAAVFKVLRRYVRCVVLSACHSEPQAAAIAQHVEVVVGMSAEIRDARAIAFAASFYENLGFGLDVQAAFDLALPAMDLSAAASGPNRDFGADAGPDPADSDAPDAPIPRLLVRDGVDASQLRFAKPAD